MKMASSSLLWNGILMAYASFLWNGIVMVSFLAPQMVLLKEALYQVRRIGAEDACPHVDE